MTHIANGEEVWLYSMGKRFLLRAVSDTVEDANSYMKKHPDTALIACFGRLNFIANKYAGVKEQGAATA